MGLEQEIIVGELFRHANWEVQSGAYCCHVTFSIYLSCQNVCLSHERHNLVVPLLFQLCTLQPG